MQNGQGVQAPPEHTQKKTRFGIRAKGLRNLELIKDAEQCFIFLNGLYEKATGVVRSPSRPVT